MKLSDNQVYEQIMNATSFPMKLKEMDERITALERQVSSKMERVTSETNPIYYTVGSGRVCDLIDDLKEDMIIKYREKIYFITHIDRGNLITNWTYFDNDKELSFLHESNTEQMEILEYIQKLVTEDSSTTQEEPKPLKTGRVCDLWDELRVGTVILNGLRQTPRAIIEKNKESISTAIRDNLDSVQWGFQRCSSDIIEILSQPDSAVSEDESVDKKIKDYDSLCNDYRLAHLKIKSLEKEIEGYKTGNDDLVTSRDRLEKCNYSLSEEISRLDKEIIELQIKNKKLQSTPSNSTGLKPEKNKCPHHDNDCICIHCAKQYPVEENPVEKVCKNCWKLGSEYYCPIPNAKCIVDDLTFCCNQWEAKDE